MASPVGSVSASSTSMISMKSDKLNSPSAGLLRGILCITGRVSKDGCYALNAVELNKENLKTKEKMDEFFNTYAVAFCIKNANNDIVLFLPNKWCAVSGDYKLFIERNKKIFECTDCIVKPVPPAICDSAKKSYYQYAVASLSA